MDHDSAHLAFAQSLLVAVDFSKQSEAALVFAARLCKCTGCRLTILHVVHERVSQPGFFKRNGQFEQILPLNDIALRMMKEFLEDLRERQPELDCLDNAEIMTVIGLPENRILEIAESISADLLVLGGNGRSTLSKLLKGSVAEDVVRKSQIPVHVVHTNKRKGAALPIMGVPRDAFDPSVPGRYR